MDFLKSVRSSIYGPEYYAALKKKPLSYSIQYFFVLTAWLAVIAAIIFLFSIIPALNGFLSNTGAKIVQYYPDELQINISHGKVSTNVAEPYFLKMPAEFAVSSTIQSNGLATSTPDNLLVIDTKDPFSIDEFNNDRTLFLLTSDSIVYLKDQSTVIQPIGADTSLVLNKGSVTSFLQKIQPYFKLIDIIVAIFIPIGIFVSLAFRLIYLFALALLIWLFARVRKIDAGYKQAYRWGIHLMTLPLILGALLWLLVPSFNFPFLFTILALISLVINLKDMPAAKD
jgi:hypothetical protein